MYEADNRQDEQDEKYDALPWQSQEQLEHAIAEIIDNYKDDVETLVDEWTQSALEGASWEVVQRMKVLRRQWGDDLVDAAIRHCDDTLAANPDSPTDRSIRDVEEEMESNEDAA
jgi:hypothetical protein